MAGIHLIPFAVCVTDEKGFFEHVNGSYCMLYQYSREELIGQHFTKVVPGHDKAKLTKLHDLFIQNEEEATQEWEVEARDGTIMLVIATSVFVEEHGNPKKVTFIVNVSDTKKTERELRKTVKKLNALVASQENALELLMHDLRGPIANILSLAEFLSSENFTPVQKDMFGKRLHKSAQRAFELTYRL